VSGGKEQFFVWSRFAYSESARSYLFSMESLNGRSGTFRCNHGDKAETARPAVGAINREINLDHIAMGGKQIHKILVRSGSSQIVHV